MSISAPILPNPTLFEFYEGLDPAQFSFLTGANLNAASKELKANQDAILAFTITKLNAIATQPYYTELFTANKDQTVFTTASNYVLGKSMVFLNGIKLNSTQVDCTTGTNFTVNIPLESGDKLEFVGFTALV